MLEGRGKSETASPTFFERVAQFVRDLFGDVGHQKIEALSDETPVLRAIAIGPIS